MIGLDSIMNSSPAIRRACDELSRRLRSGIECGAEEFLAADPALASDPDAALELLYTEFVVRQQLGQQPAPSEWIERFPQWRAELEQLFEVHALVDGGETLAAGLSGTQRGIESPSSGQDCLATNRDQGRFLGGYEILQEIGRGGMGVVYQAKQRGLSRIVALKMILPPHGERERARFRAEAEATAKLSHPNIVPIYEVGQEGDCPFLSMEFVAGQSLEKQLAESLLVPRAAAELLQTLARAVAYAHEQGIIHRDLKPANILLSVVSRPSSVVTAPLQRTTDDGQLTIPKITDFGLAKTMNEGQVAAQSVAIVGTPSYMAPEQCQSGSKVGPAADIYSLGSILYEALTGRPPFRGQTAIDILELVRSQEPVPPSRLVPKIPRDLETICLKCLAKQPEQRYASAAALAADLRRFLTGEPIVARPVGRVERGMRWCQRNPAIAALAGGIALALVCGTAISTSLAVWALEEKARANQHADQELAARELAEQRFVQAEKAVEEYLDGIENHERLKEADFFELRKRLLISAVPFYEDFVKQKPGDAALEIKRGRAYGRLALLRNQIGEREEAAADLLQMRAVFEQLGTTDPRVRPGMATSYHNLATVLVALGRYPEAEVEYGKSLELSRKLVAEHPDDIGQRRQWALCRRNFGLLLSTLGKRDQAAVELRGALETMEELAAAHPDVAAYRDDLAAIHSFLGVRLTTDAEEAETHSQEAVTLAQQLTDEFPNQPEFRAKLGTAHHNLAVVLTKGRKDVEEAAAEIRMAIALRRQLTAEFPAIPEYRRQLAMNRMGLTDVLRRSGQWDEAKVEIEAALALLAELTADFPATVSYRNDLALAHGEHAGILAGLNKPDEAEAAFRRAIDYHQQFAANVPSVPDYRRRLAKNQFDLARLLMRSGRWSDAEIELRKSALLRQGLLDQFPDDRGSLRGLVLSKGNLGMSVANLKRPDEAKSLYREALPLWQALIEQSAPSSADVRDFGSTHYNLADLLRRDGAIDEARRHYALAAEHFLSAAAAVPSSVRLAGYLQMAWHSLGDMALLQKDHAAAADAADKLAQVRPDTASDAELAARFFGRCVTLAEQDAALSETGRQALAASYADRAMEHLHEAVCRGHNDPEKLKTLAALAPLRVRPDFQQLVQELEAR